MAAPIWTSPEVVASGIGALGSIGNTFFGNMLGRSNMSSQTKASKELMDYEWEHFKSPKAQVSALAAAGLNPAVALGQGGSGFAATPSPSMPNNPFVSPTTIGDISEFVTAMANAKLAGLKGVGQKLENEFNAKTLEDRISQVGLQNNWTKEQTANLQQEWNKTTAEINMLSKDSEIKSIDLQKHAKLVDAIIDSYVQRSNLDAMQAKSLREQLPIVLDKLQAETDVLSVDADLAKDYKETMTQVGIVGNVVKVLGILAKILGK